MSSVAAGKRGGIAVRDDDDGTVVATGSVNQDVVALRRPKAPKWSSLRNPQWVSGRTLDRIQLIGGVPQTMAVGDRVSAWVKPASGSMLALGCDRCVGPHYSKTTACSANLGIPTPMTDAAQLYDRNTGNPVDYVLDVIDESGTPTCVIFLDQIGEGMWKKWVIPWACSIVLLHNVLAVVPVTLRPAKRGVKKIADTLATSALALPHTSFTTGERW